MPARQCIPIFSNYSNNFAMTIIIFQYILFVFRLSVRYIPICAESLKRNFIHTADGFFTECPSFWWFWKYIDAVISLPRMNEIHRSSTVSFSKLRERYSPRELVKLNDDTGQWWRQWLYASKDSSSKRPAFRPVRAPTLAPERMSATSWPQGLRAARCCVPPLQRHYILQISSNIHCGISDPTILMLEKARQAILHGVPRVNSSLQQNMKHHTETSLSCSTMWQDVKPRPFFRVLQLPYLLLPLFTDLFVVSQKLCAIFTLFSSWWLEQGSFKRICI